MSILLNDSIQNNSPKPVDNKYGIFASGAFRAYTSLAEANSSIPSAYRSIGLTALIDLGSGPIEYWYKSGILDSNLIPKVSPISVTTPLTIGSGTVGINQSTISTDGYLSTGDWNTFNSKVDTAANVGTNAGLFTSKVSGVLNFKSIGVAANAGLIMSVGSTDLVLQIDGVKQFNTATTTNNTPTVVGSVIISDNSAGFVVISMVAVSTAPGSCLLSRKYMTYQKLAGVLTNLGVTTDIIGPSLSGFTTASWDIVLNSGTGNIDIQVTGEGSSIIWKPKLEQYTS
jgi:hypothetical protein